MDSIRVRWVVAFGAAVLAVAAAMSFAWRHTALAELVSLENLTELIGSVSGVWWAPLLVALLYTPAALVMFPRALLTIGAALVFGAWKAIALALGGVVLSAAILYYAGRRLGPSAIRRPASPALARLKKLLQKKGFLAVTAVGLLPLAPFSVLALAAGSLRIRLRDFLAGVVLAHLPGTLATAFLGDQVAAALTHDREISGFVIAGIVAGVCAMALLVWQLGKRLKE